MVKSGRSWYADAACKDKGAALFMAHDPDGIEKAKKICATCSVQKPCEKAYFSVDCIAGGKTLYERLVESWRRVETIEQRNFG